MHERIVGVVAMLIGLVLLVLPWTPLQRGPAGLDDLTVVASGLVMSVFGVAITHGGAQPKTQRTAELRISVLATRRRRSD
jgi:drug/metabolite transporter (DMT)-like permease